MCFYRFICDFFFISFGEIFQNFHSTSHATGYEFNHEKISVCNDRIFDFCKFISLTAAKKMVT